MYIVSVYLWICTHAYTSPVTCVTGRCKRWGGRDACPNSQVLWFAGLKWRSPWSTQCRASLCWKTVFPLLNQNFQGRYNLDGSPAIGSPNKTQTSLVLQFDSYLHAMSWDQVPGSGFTGCDFSQGKPGATFAYLYSSAVTSPPLVCLCSINLQNRARLVISPWSLFLLISLQNRSTWMLLFKSLMRSPCQAVVQAAWFALNGTRRWNLLFICQLHCQERKYYLKRQQEHANVEL